MLKKFLLGCLPFLLMFLLIPAALYAPDFYARRCEARLLSSPKDRPEMEGMLSEQAQDIPVLYTLYRNRYLGSHYDTIYSEIPQEQAQKLLWDRLFVLNEHQLLKPDFLNWLFSAIDTSIKASPSSISEGQGIQGISTQFSLPDVESLSVSVNTFVPDDLVITFSVSSNLSSAPLTPDLVFFENFLERYKSYLGLDVLTDWKAPVSGDSNITSIWSEEGQIYLFCLQDWDDSDHTFSFGAISMSPEDFRGVELKETVFASDP